MSFLKKTRKVHITFGDFKRIITYKKGEEVQELGQHFLRVFSDVLSDDVTLANVKFQRYDHAFQDYEDIAHDTKLQENAKVTAKITSTHGKKASNSLSHSQHVVIPEYPILGTSELQFHPIKKDVYYRLWNLTTDGLIQKDPNDTAIVPCSGGFSGPDITVVQARSAGPNLFHLVFRGTNGESDLYITAKEEGQGITLTDKPLEYAKFEPIYFWSYTLFRSIPKSDTDFGMYLGSDENFLATLIKVDEDYNLPAHYPSPQALFIANKVKTDGSEFECWKKTPNEDKMKGNIESTLPNQVSN